MTVVSSTDFKSNQDKYLEMALHERVFIQNGDQMLLLIYTNTPDEMNTYHDASVYEEALEPDDDFRRTITVDEVFDAVKDNIRKKYPSKCK